MADKTLKRGSTNWQEASKHAFGRSGSCSGTGSPQQCTISRTLVSTQSELTCCKLCCKDSLRLNRSTACMHA